MNRNISFDESFPRYEKRKRNSRDDDDDDSYEKMQDRMFKRQYDKQFKENVEYLGKQRNAADKLISEEEWENLDSATGPKGEYTGDLDLQEGPELEANLNALENRGEEVRPKINQRTGVDVSKKGVWGGKTKKSKKSKKVSNKKSRKSKKAKKSKKTKKSRKAKK